MNTGANFQCARLFETINEQHAGVRRDDDHQPAARQATVIVTGITNTWASSSANSLMSMP
jgi:hypothetical protein